MRDKNLSVRDLLIPQWLLCDILQLVRQQDKVMSVCPLVFQVSLQKVIDVFL